MIFLIAGSFFVCSVQKLRTVTAVICELTNLC